MKVKLFLCVFVIIVAMCINAGLHNPNAKNHHNGLCDFCEAEGGHRAATNTYKGLEACEACCLEHLDQDIINSKYHPHSILD